MAKKKPEPFAQRLREVGQAVRCVSRVHGAGTGKIVRVTRWRHKVYYHMAWQWDSGSRMASRDLAGRDDADWEECE